MSKLLSKEDLLKGVILREEVFLTNPQQPSGACLCDKQKLIESLDKYAKQDSIALLKWLLTPNEEMTITSGDNVWYVNGEETSHEKLYELYSQSKMK